MPYAKIVTTDGVYYLPDVEEDVETLYLSLQAPVEIGVHPHGMRGGIDAETLLYIVFNPAHIVSVSVPG